MSNRLLVLMVWHLQVDIESREVSELEARNWCTENGDIPYIETSARDAINVDSAFATAVNIWVNLEETLDRLGTYGENSVRLNRYTTRKNNFCCGGV